MCAPHGRTGDDPLKIILADFESYKVHGEFLKQPVARTSGGGKVSHACKERAFHVVSAFDEFGNQEVEIGITLTMRMGAQIHRHALNRNREIRPVIEVEATQKVLVGFAAARMLRDHHTGNHFEQFSAAQKWSQIELLVADGALGRCHRLADTIGGATLNPKGSQLLDGRGGPWAKRLGAVTTEQSQRTQD